MFFNKNRASGVEWLVVGLGNPGDKYENTRHNVGFLTVDHIADEARVPVQKLKYRALTNTVELGGAKVLLMKPVTYMNLSGEAVGEAARFYKIPADQFEQVVAFFPMITSPDTVIVGKLAEGADEKAVTDALEAYRQSQEDTFSWYLSQNLPKVQDARTVVENGYLLFFIGENADQAEELFHAYVEAQG